MKFVRAIKSTIYRVKTYFDQPECRSCWELTSFEKRIKNGRISVVFERFYLMMKE